MVLSVSRRWRIASRRKPTKPQRARERDAPMLVVVEEPGEDLVHVGAGADEEQDDQQERLEVEEGRLDRGKHRD